MRSIGEGRCEEDRKLRIRLLDSLVRSVFSFYKRAYDDRRDSASHVSLKSKEERKIRDRNRPGTSKIRREVRKHRERFNQMEMQEDTSETGDSNMKVEREK